MTELGGNEIDINIPVSHEVPQPPISIKSYSASEITDDLLERLDVYNLTRQLAGQTDPDKIKHLTKELMQSTVFPNRKTYIAESGGNAIGYVIFDKLEMRKEDKLGNIFASWINHADHEFTASIWNTPHTIAALRGATTDSNWQGKGIQRKIWEALIQEDDPTIIVGESKNPAAVVARANATKPLGYRTFYGAMEVTPEVDDYSETPTAVESIIKGNIGFHTSNQGEIKAIGDGLLLAPNRIFTPETPDVHTFPQRIKDSFQPVIAAQSRIGKQGTVVNQLISIKSTFLANKG